MKIDFYSITTLRDLVDYDARKLASAEAQLDSILPEWINRAGSVTLKVLLKQYMNYVKQHVQRIDDYINKEKINLFSRTNNVMQALILETREKMANSTDAELMDACLISGIQGINHYKICMYGTAAAFAKSLGNDTSATIFRDAKKNEKEIDKSLSLLANQEINSRARAPIVLGNSKVDKYTH